MRRILLASTLLSPLFLTAAAVASTPATDASASTQVPVVSTGVTSPHVVSTAAVELPAEASARIPSDAEVVLQLNLDEKGNVQDVQVVKSVNPELNAPVVSAVRQFRFSPAKLDNQAIPSDMKLIVDLER